MRLTEEIARATAEAMGANRVEFVPESTVNIPYYRISRMRGIGFEWEGTGATWEEALQNAHDSKMGRVTL